MVATVWKALFRRNPIEIEFDIFNEWGVGEGDMLKRKLRCTYTYFSDQMDKHRHPGLSRIAAHQRRVADVE